MGIFSAIRDKIFGKKEAPAVAAAPATTAAPAAPQPVAITEVDVEALLDAKPGADKLNWRTSIVDLLKLLDIDSSFAARKELAGELGDSDYSGTAEENIALHRKTLQEIARNGGKVPASFLD